nr:HAD family phosphatase [uncultured Mediterraneibacter sp.]
MLEGIKGVIFDMDGTLIDSMWVWEEVDVDYVKRYQLVEPEGFYEAIEGMSFTDVAKYYKKTFPQIRDSVEQIKADWMEMGYRLYRDEVELKSGVKEFLEELKKRGIKIGIATSNDRDMTEMVLEARGILQEFDAICTSDEVKIGKPAPDVYLKAAEDLGVDPKDCLIFEDVSAGLMAGKSAGMKTCAVADKFSEDQIEKKRALADYFIQDYFEVLKGTYEQL